MFDTISLASFIWLILGVIFVVLEFLIPGVIIIFFGFGGLLVGVLSLFLGFSINSQILLFLGSSVVFLILFRRYLKGIFTGFRKDNADTTRNISDHVGKRAVVQTRITPSSQGTVLYNGTVWEAESVEEIEEGETVQIIGLDSIVLKVVKID